VGGVWIGLSIWAAVRVAPVTAPSAAHRSAAGAVVVGAALIVALAGHTLFFSRTAARPVFVPAVLVAAIWAGLCAAGQIPPPDAIGLAVMIVGWLLLTPSRAWAVPAAVLMGVAVGVSPLLVGSAVGLCLALRGTGLGHRHRLGRFAVAGCVAAGVAAVALIGLAVGRPPGLWESSASASVLDRLGPAARWHCLASLADLVVPVLVVGVLGAVVADDGGNWDGDSPSPGRRSRIHQGLRGWLICNAVLAVTLPGVCAEHVLVLIAPAAMLVAPGWLALRDLASRCAPLRTALPGAVCLFLLAVLLWAPAAAAGHLVLMAWLPP